MLILSTFGSAISEACEECKSLQQEPWPNLLLPVDEAATPSNGAMEWMKTEKHRRR
jgi:hypothetical protein